MMMNMFHYFSEFEFEGCFDNMTIYDGENWVLQFYKWFKWNNY